LRSGSREKKLAHGGGPGKKRKDSKVGRIEGKKEKKKEKKSARFVDSPKKRSPRFLRGIDWGKFTARKEKGKKLTSTTHPAIETSQPSSRS